MPDAFTWEEMAEQERKQETLCSADFLEELSARLHEVYQKEAHRRGDVRHADAYADLSEATKEWDRVLARWIIQHWTPKFDPDWIPEA